MAKKTDPVELLRTINAQIVTIDRKWKASRAAYVVADMREGKAIVANGSFKFSGGHVTPGEEIRIGERDVMDRIEMAMSQPGNSRMFLTKDEYKDRERQRELKAAVDSLYPLVQELEASQREAEEAAAELREAEEAVKQWTARLEPAEKRYKRAAQAASEYVSKIDLGKLNLLDI
jgi:hypothetical protein